MTAIDEKIFLKSIGVSGMLSKSEYHFDYVTYYWIGNLKIADGRGSFDGASGELLVDDYFINIDNYTHYHWTVKIIVVKREKNNSKKKVANEPFYLLN